MRDCRLERVEAVVQRQQRVALKRNHDRLVLDRHNRRAWLFRAGRNVAHRRPPFPLGDRLDPAAGCQRPQARLTILYR
jgi:RNase P/RNase MRP subunit p30